MGLEWFQAIEGRGLMGLPRGGDADASTHPSKVWGVYQNGLGIGHSRREDHGTVRNLFSSWKTGVMPSDCRKIRAKPRGFLGSMLMEAHGRKVWE